MLKLIASEYSSVSINVIFDYIRFRAKEIFHLLESAHISKLKFNPAIALQKLWKMTLCHEDLRYIVVLLCAQTYVMYRQFMIYAGWYGAEVSTHACFPLHLLSSWWSGRADQIESRYRNSSKFIENYWYANMIKCMHLLI